MPRFLLALASLLPLSAADAPTASAATIPAAITCRGTYEWVGMRYKDSVACVLTPGEKGTLTLVYTAIYRKQTYIYDGTLGPDAKDPRLLTGTAKLRSSKEGDWTVQASYDAKTGTFKAKGSARGPHGAMAGTLTAQRETAVSAKPAS